MKKWFLWLLFTLPLIAHGQVTSHTAQRFVTYPADPAVCTVGDVEYNSVGLAFKFCTATNTWTSVVGAGGITFPLAQNIVPHVNATGQLIAGILQDNGTTVTIPVLNADIYSADEMIAAGTCATLDVCSSNLLALGGGVLLVHGMASGSAASTGMTITTTVQVGNNPKNAATPAHEYLVMAVGSRIVANFTVANGGAWKDVFDIGDGSGIICLGNASGTLNANTKQGGCEVQLPSGSLVGNGVAPLDPSGNNQETIVVEGLNFNTLAGSKVQGALFYCTGCYSGTHFDNIYAKLNGPGMGMMITTPMKEVVPATTSSQSGTTVTLNVIGPGLTNVSTSGLAVNVTVANAVSSLPGSGVGQPVFFHSVGTATWLNGHEMMVWNASATNLVVAPEGVNVVGAATNATPIVITSTPNNFVSGEVVMCPGINSATYGPFQVSAITISSPPTGFANTGFTLLLIGGANSVGNAAYTANTASCYPVAQPPMQGMGTVVAAATNATPIVVTGTQNLFQNGQQVECSGGLVNTGINGIFYVQSVTQTGFTLLGSTGNGTYTANTAICWPANIVQPSTMIAYGSTADTGYVTLTSNNSSHNLTAQGRVTTTNCSNANGNVTNQPILNLGSGLGTVQDAANTFQYTGSGSFTGSQTGCKFQLVDVSGNAYTSISSVIDIHNAVLDGGNGSINASGQGNNPEARGALFSTGLYGSGTLGAISISGVWNNENSDPNYANTEFNGNAAPNQQPDANCTGFTIQNEDHTEPDAPAGDSPGGSGFKVRDCHGITFLAGIDGTGAAAGSAIAITNTAQASGVVTFTNSGVNGLSAGQWVFLRDFTVAAGDSFLNGVYAQVLASGLTNTTFKINLGTTISTGAITGNAYVSNNARVLDIDAFAYHSTYSIHVNSELFNQNYGMLVVNRLDPYRQSYGQVIHPAFGAQTMPRYDFAGALDFHGIGLSTPPPKPAFPNPLDRTQVVMVERWFASKTATCAGQNGWSGSIVNAGTGTLTAQNVPDIYHPGTTCVLNTGATANNGQLLALDAGTANGFKNPVTSTSYPFDRAYGFTIPTLASAGPRVMVGLLPAVGSTALTVPPIANGIFIRYDTDQTVMAAASTVTYSAGVVTVNTTNTQGAVANQTVYLSGFNSTATGLNGRTVQLVTVTANTSVTFNFPTSQTCAAACTGNVWLTNDNHSDGTIPPSLQGCVSNTSAVFCTPLNVQPNTGNQGYDYVQMYSEKPNRIAWQANGAPEASICSDATCTLNSATAFPAQNLADGFEVFNDTAATGYTLIPYIWSLWGWGIRAQ